jgi:meso-butanediol dehydrogenase / (S,S)-butanediol dehydrogenase / diacetyl reductase
MMRMRRDISVIIGIGGMGLAIARRIGSGRSLLLGDINAVLLEAAAVTLRGEGHTVTTQVVDVSDLASVAELGGAAAGLGAVTAIAHTAGVSPVQASPERILRVDLLGVAHVLDVFASVVAPGGAGVIVASMAGHGLHSRLPPADELALADTPSGRLLTLPSVKAAAESARSAYWLAKRGNQLRVQAAAALWGERGARINSISPGLVITRMGQAELTGPLGERLRTTVESSPAGRAGTPEDVAAAAAFLLGPDTTFVTGTDLLVDGGASAARARKTRLSAIGERSSP